MSAIISHLALQPDGKILVRLEGGSNARHHGIYRFNSDGTLDSTFNADIRGSAIKSIAIQPDGEVLIAGAFVGEQNGTY